MEEGTPAEKPGSANSPPPAGGPRKLLRWGVVGLAVVVALIAWVATRGGDDGSPESASTATASAAPRIVDVDELRESAADQGQPIYWAGPLPGRELQLTELGTGGAQVAYLPDGAEPGEGTAKTLTIGSYPLADPERAVRGFGERPGATVEQAGDGREVVAGAEAPTSVYFASPDNSVQVEVYDPSAARAMRLALSRRVKPVG